MTLNTKLSCRNVWKLYGPSVEALLQRTPAPTGEEIRRSGAIGAVRNANIDIKEGEIFVIMGLLRKKMSRNEHCQVR